ncbi:NAD(P)/FAD-dependent oxidoreductase [Mesorhizobium sp. B3-1-3]|uniref:NAD(P)/FAD-dependent oxidoreductase n=1 Tax=unclassified Mesorhizobium TaxID=325217 RepID=UPI0011271AA9|nr:MULTISPECIES: NAD(P)/FAD-dependent oxidoreductase [unclassified Mesorhizobium]TPI61480.1 NAD(P)/FAD-dependent oxidoreductase [Mesorhizobium sp. B3-1-8]TPI70569.1 NAD(P)/FAD-dependent oxidoreductase [Mesorhizobium sp. B3-1-3]
MDKLNTVVIGAGVVGLAIARALAMAGREVVVLERHNAIGTECSSRNSEVIHAGIYYSPGSLKARLCVEGRQELYRYCLDRNISHRSCGKIIVATSETQASTLTRIKETGIKNGVSDLRTVGADEIRDLEPELICFSGLMSPSSGIVDSHGLMLAFQADLEAAGGVIAFNTNVIGGRCLHDGICLTIGDDGYEVQASLVVNSGGLGAQILAANLIGFDRRTVPPRHLAKGNYFSLSGKPPFSHLIYPVPSGGGLGVHATIDLAGRVRFGPDVEWIDEVDYLPNGDRAAEFYDAVADYWPGVRTAFLSPEYAGIRPKIERPGGSATDFAIHDRHTHGQTGLINLYGIESPGLTASLAIGRVVSEMSGKA